MITPQSHAPLAPAFGRELVNAVRPYLRGRRGLIVLAVVVAVAGLALNWGWLVAIGAAPVLLTALPCVAMCALGLCMNRTVGGACATDKQGASDQPPVSTPDASTLNVVPIPAKPRNDRADADSALLATAEPAPCSDSTAGLKSTQQRS